MGNISEKLQESNSLKIMDQPEGFYQPSDGGGYCICHHFTFFPYLNLLDKEEGGYDQNFIKELPNKISAIDCIEFTQNFRLSMAVFIDDEYDTFEIAHTGIILETGLLLHNVIGEGLYLTRGLNEKLIYNHRFNLKHSDRNMLTCFLDNVRQEFKEIPTSRTLWLKDLHKFRAEISEAARDNFFNLFPIPDNKVGTITNPAAAVRARSNTNQAAQGSTTGNNSMAASRTAHLPAQAAFELILRRSSTSPYKELMINMNNDETC